MRALFALVNNQCRVVAYAEYRVTFVLYINNILLSKSLSVEEFIYLSVYWCIEIVVTRVLELLSDYFSHGNNYFFVILIPYTIVKAILFALCSAKIVNGINVEKIAK